MGTKTTVNDAFLISKGFSISDDKSLLDLDFVFDFLSFQSYWAKHLSFEKFKTSIENSACFGVYQENKQIGFARVVTDKSTFAYLADVFIDTKYRKLSLSKWLVQTILSYPDYNNVRRWLLATADAHSLYAQFGFETLKQPERFMQIFKPYTKDN